jgi:uncharacterized repeat protein (TIGR01451 family)
MGKRKISYTRRAGLHRGVLSLIFLFISVIFFPKQIFCDPVAGVPAGERVLVIYLNRSYPTGVKNSIVSALTAAGATVDQLAITEGDNDGFYDDLVAAGYSLDDYCEVWDIRFNDAHQGIAYMNTGVMYDDSITSGCPTCDAELLRSFMLSGGHVYLQGEHQNFYGRNEPVLQFIADVAGAVSYPGLITAAKTWTSFSSTPENFNTDFNTLVKIDSYYVGTIINTPAGIGNGHPMTVDTTYNTFGGVALDLAFSPSDLLIGAGKLFVSFDTNMFDPGDVYWTASGDEEYGYVQNIYDFLSGCYKYTLTKTLSNADICTGETTVYTLCYDNIGDKALNSVSLWDTIPTCLSIISTSVAPTGQSGNLLWWNFASVAPGESLCIDITVRAETVPPCP